MVYWDQRVMRLYPLISGLDCFIIPNSTPATSTNKIIFKHTSQAARSRTQLTCYVFFLIRDQKD